MPSRLPPGRRGLKRGKGAISPKAAKVAFPPEGVD